ncbi:MAG: hypothetical protein V7606_577 [Burkholderiales bacterium]
MLTILKRLYLITPLLLAGCMSMPSGPSVLVLPGTGKNFDQFRGDDMVCRQFAQEQLEGSSPNRVAAASGIASATVGTILGAAAGAAIDGSHGAAVGAGSGLALGGLIGTGTGDSSARSVQQRYDFGYQQCMYAKSHRVPVAGRFVTESSLSAYPPPPPPPGWP